MSCGIHGDWGSNNTQDGTSTDHTYVKLINSTVTNCDCGQFFYVVHTQFKMHVFTENLTVTNNKFSFAHVEYGYFTELGSTFTNIEANNEISADGSVYYGSSRSVATFTNTQISSCKSSKKGGAIYLSVEDTSATFSNISAT